MASAGARAYNGSLSAVSLAGHSGQSSWLGGGKLPSPEAETFLILESIVA